MTKNQDILRHIRAAQRPAPVPLSKLVQAPISPPTAPSKRKGPFSPSSVNLSPRQMRMAKAPRYQSPTNSDTDVGALALSISDISMSPEAKRRRPDSPIEIVSVVRHPITPPRPIHQVVIDLTSPETHPHPPPTRAKKPSIPIDLTVSPVKAETTFKGGMGPPPVQAVSIGVARGTQFTSFDQMEAKVREVYEELGFPINRTSSTTETMVCDNALCLLNTNILSLG